jgi:hypothetical protein
VEETAGDGVEGFEDGHLVDLGLPGDTDAGDLYAVDDAVCGGEVGEVNLADLCSRVPVLDFPLRDEERRLPRDVMRGRDGTEFEGGTRGVENGACADSHERCFCGVAEECAVVGQAKGGVLRVVLLGREGNGKVLRLSRRECEGVAWPIRPLFTRRLGRLG